MPKIIFKPEIQAIEITEDELNAVRGTVCRKFKAPKVIQKGKLDTARRTIVDINGKDVTQCKTPIELYNQLASYANAVQEELGYLRDKKLHFETGYDAKVRVFIVDKESDSDFQNRVAEAVESDRRTEEIAIYQYKREKYEEQQKKLKTAEAYKRWLKDNNML